VLGPLRRCVAAALVALAMVPADGARAQSGAEGTIKQADWQLYRDKFLRDGRIVDDANGNISHSEGQGYGMLLAVLAGDRVRFEEIWGFTLTELLIRSDGLAAWRWDPNTKPHVSDVNDASDGDILIAYALARAGMLWNDSRYLAASRQLSRAIASTVILTFNGGPVLLPGVVGFTAKDRPDGPVVNPSYWVFEAFPLLTQVAPVTDWNALSRRGLALLDQAQFGPRKLPSDWIGLKTRPQPADGFDSVFGYNSLRIPLYLLRAGLTDKNRLEGYRKFWVDQNDGKPAIVDIASGRILTVLADPGYRILAASLDCALRGKPLPDDLKQFQPTMYYPSTLHLLTLSYLTEKYPQCL
jgi:endoglucanase